MYYRIVVRLVGRFYNEGYIKIQNNQFEGYLTEDYIKGSIADEKDTNKQVISIFLKCKQYKRQDFSGLNIVFKVDEFYLPDKYALYGKIKVRDEETRQIIEDELKIEISFSNKVLKKQIPDFEENLKMVKEKLGL